MQKRLRLAYVGTASFRVVLRQRLEDQLGHIAGDCANAFRKFQNRDFVRVSYVRRQMLR